MNAERIIELPPNDSPPGSIIGLDACKHVPFNFKRIFYIFNVPKGRERAGHAMINCEEFIVPVLGSFDVILDDGKTISRYHLQKNGSGLHVPSLIWIDITNISPDTVYLVLASQHYKDTRYFSNYDEYRQQLKQGKREAIS